MVKSGFKHSNSYYNFRLCALFILKIELEWESCRDSKGGLKTAFGLCQRMMHFFHQYLLYVTFEILEPHWLILRNAVRDATNLDMVTLCSKSKFSTSCLDSYDWAWRFPDLWIKMEISRQYQLHVLYETVCEQVSIGGNSDQINVCKNAEMMQLTSNLQSLSVQ